MHCTNLRQSESLRRGFTLVELLMVIVIIGVMLALTLRIVGAFITQSRHSATDATIRKVQGLLNSRAEALHRLTKRSGFVESRTEYSDARKILEGKNPPISDVALQRVIATKLLQRTYFPQRKAEISDSTLYPKLSSAASLNSSEILYDFLTQSNVLGDLQAGTDAFSTSEVVDVDANGFPEFVDAWGNKLRFYRWSSRLFRPDGWPSTTPTDVTVGIDTTTPKILLSTLPTFSGNLARDLARDPDDPLRRCGNTTYFPNFERVTTGVHMNTPGTYHVMLIVSAGPDGILGLYEPDDSNVDDASDGDTNADNENFVGHLAKVRDADALADDITYLRLRIGGQ